MNSEEVTELEIEQAVQEKNLNAPRITSRHIDGVIIGEEYHTFPGTTVTVCCLTLRNGFNVIGESACASLENFDPEIGRRIAFGNAREKVWQLEGYLLKESLKR